MPLARAFVPVALLFVLLPTGCSLVFVKPVTVQRGHRKVSNQCTESQAAPVLDVLATGLLAFRTGYALVAPDSTYQGARLSRPANVGISAGLMLLFLGSAVHGLHSTTECEEVRAVEAFDPSPVRQTRARPRAPTQRPPQEADDEDEEGEGEGDKKGAAPSPEAPPHW